MEQLGGPAGGGLVQGGAHAVGVQAVHVGPGPQHRLHLARRPAILDGLRLVRREYPTDIGPVDLLCRDAQGEAVAIEVKRRGEIDGVEQLTRYLEFLNRDPLLRPVRGVFVAQEIRPQARVLAEDRGIGCMVVDYDNLRGVESNELKLF